MSLMETNKQINLLSNEPCRKDAFEGHSHQKIAVQVARIVRDDDERHIIGIEGGWGSGKSNLISLVNKNLNCDDVYNDGYVHKDSAYPFFIYDAWGHQADYQRRAILEELTHDLTIEKKILDEKKWKKKLQELLAKKRKTTTKEVPSLGIGLIVGVVLTILTPLIVFVIGLIPIEKWWLRGFIAVLPYIVGIWYAIHDRRKSLKSNGQECTVANVLKELILVYKDQIKENETYTTVSEKEPSSAEFKAWMEEVNKDLASAGKTLVIVFDNMDRLPSQKVESLWSSIHSFFSDKTYSNIKVMIPFDRQHVQKAFKKEDAGGESYGNDFINKTFDVVFRVPPPIMSGWQQYMSDMWKKAFGEDEELHLSVLQIYDALSKNHTPRKIIAFINEVATVKMTMGSEIPDSYIALFVFGKEKIEKYPIGELLNPSFMGDVKFEYEKDPDTVKYLSALYYQLPADHALDVVFTREATDALNTGNTERLHEMMEHIDLSGILGNAILKVSDVEKATKALAGLDEYIDYADFGSMPSWLNKIWEDLYRKCQTMGVTWNEIREYHVPLYQHLFDETLANELVEGYLSIEDEKLNAKQYVEAVDQLKENNDLIDMALVKHFRNASPKLFLELLKYTEANYEEYGFDVELTALDEYLAGLEQSDVMELDVIPHIAFDKEKAFPKYKARLKAWLEDTSGIDDKLGVSTLFERLKEVSGKPIGFADFFGDASIYSEWNELADAKYSFKYDLLAMRIARRDSFNTNYISVFNDALENYDDDDAEALAKVIEYYITYGELLLHSDYYKDMPLVATVVEMITVKSYGVSRMNLMDCLVHFDKTSDDFQIDEESLFERMNGWLQYVDFKKITVDKLPSGVLEIASKSDIKLGEAVRTACDEYYSSLSQDQWKDHILKKENTYRIWKIYHPKKYQANFDALKSVLKNYASGVEAKQPEKALIAEWLGICMEVKHSVKGLFTEISNILKRDSMINKQKLLFFGGYILEYTDLDKQTDFVQKLIPTEIVDADVLGFMVEHIEILKDFEISDEFKEKVKHLAETSMKEDKGIRLVCEKLEIVIEEVEGDDNDEV